MSKIVEILNFEEGYKETPYRCTEGYPTIAGGIKIGPKGAAIENYMFSVPRPVGDFWMQHLINALQNQLEARSSVNAALNKCNDARRDVLLSMGYQMGADGLAAFKKTLIMIAAGDYVGAADGMLNSLWARQTPKRAKRHADAMRSGSYDPWGMK